MPESSQQNLNNIELLETVNFSEKLRVKVRKKCYQSILNLILLLYKTLDLIQLGKLYINIKWSLYRQFR